MEEKERYKLESLNGTFSHIHDTELDEWFLNKQPITELLNQQDKRIKELEETNKVLCNELTKNNIIKPNRLETCCGVPIYEVPKLKEENKQLTELYDELNKRYCKQQDELDIVREENQQLKQQLKPQPAEIVDEIKKQMDARKLEYISHLTNTHCYGLRINRIFEILDDLLKEYQR